MNIKLIFLLSLVTLIKGQETKSQWAIVGNPLAHARPCEGNDKVMVSFEPGLPPGDENQYHLYVAESLPSHTRVNMKFDSEASVTLTNPEVARVSAINDFFRINFYKNSPNLSVQVRGPATGTIPYIQSLVINSVEYCEKAKTGYLDDLVLGHQPTASVSLTNPDTTCGRRKVDHTELIVNGDQTKPGDWPWHTALYRLDGANLKYICGGTLLSKTLVLTAAHCVTLRGVPLLTDTLNVVLGKYNLIGGDIFIQEREWYWMVQEYRENVIKLESMIFLAVSKLLDSVQVYEIIVHENFDYGILNNDIALLKLKTEVIFNDYIQPACLWNANAYKKLPKGPILGTVVGWGFDNTDRLTTQLRQAIIPKVSDGKCLKSNPVFFSKMLTPQKFCAGFGNGTSPCNGDSGGGFHIFVPDTTGDTSSNAAGSYYVRGIVSTSLARRDVPICDPESYVLFTEIAKFRGWVTRYMNK